MRTLKSLLVLGVTIAMVLGAMVYAQQRKPSSPMLSAQDYVEIQQSYAYYTRDVDPGSERDASWLYADDGTFEIRGAEA